MRPLAILLALTLSSCHEYKAESRPHFRPGDIVRVKLTGERLSVVQKTNRMFVYDGRYDVRNHEGYIREMLPNELEIDQ